MDNQLNELMKKVKSTAQSASNVAAKAASKSAKKASELYEITKINIKIADIEGSIDSIYKNIGNLVYATHKDPDTDTSAIDAMLEEIEEKMIQIYELREKAGALQNYKTCTKCGQQTEKKNAFCPACGEKI